MAKIFEDDSEAERDECSFGEVDGWKRGDLPEVVNGNQEKDGKVDVEEGPSGGIAEEGDYAGQSRDEDDDRHAATG